jgi:hypothetical protein
MPKILDPRTGNFIDTTGNVADHIQDIERERDARSLGMEPRDWPDRSMQDLSELAQFYRVVAE